MQSLHRNATAVCFSALRFAPALLTRVTLCFSFTEGSLFSIAPVWERVRWRERGVELLAWCPVGKNREWRWSARKGLTGHLYWGCEVQQWLKHAQSYLLKIHGSARPITSSFLYLCLAIRQKWKVMLRNKSEYYDTTPDKCCLYECTGCVTVDNMSFRSVFTSGLKKLIHV